MEVVLPLAWLGSAYRMFARADESTSPPVRLSTAYGRAVCDEVLAATSLEDLSERLDALAIDSAFWKAELAAAERKNSGPLTLKPTLDMPSLSATLGPTAANRCQQGWTALLGALQRLQKLGPAMKTQISDQLGKMADSSKTRANEEGTTKQADTSASSEREFDMVDAAYDLRLGTTVRQLAARILRTLAAATVIARAEEHGRRFDPWLALGLANFFAEQPEALAAKLSDTDAIFDWIGRAFADIQASVDMKLAFEDWARRPHGDVFFPFDDADRAVR